MADRHNPPRGWRGAQPSGTPASATSHQTSASSGKRKQIFTVLAVMLALAGAVVGIVYSLGPAPKPYFVPLFITEYSAPVPVNFMAEPDRLALVEGNYFEHMSTFGSQQRNKMLEELDKLSELKPSESLVLYVCAFARASEKGEVLLLPANFNPDDSQSGVTLREALQKVKDCRAGHKLLILDTMRPLADPRLGVLSNDVASRIVAELNSAEKDPHRLVLLSCSPGQASLASEDLGRSVFGYYVEEGLRGWADGYNADNNRDGHVSARELALFVNRRVDRWAEHNRGTRQTPILIPKDGKDDFELVALEHDQAQPKVPAPEPME
jgi:hypothetical protein